MTFKYQIKRTGIVKTILFTLLILVLIVPILTFGFESRRDFNTLYHNNSDNDPEIQGFSKEDYSPLLTEEKQGLGAINVTGIYFNEPGFFNYTTKYPGYYEDWNSTALNVSFDEIRFVRTIKVAQIDNIGANIEDFNKTTILLNETLSVQYNKSMRQLNGSLIYGPRLYPCHLNQLFVKNGSATAIKVNEGNYTIDDDNFLIFNYDIYFNGATAANFTMYLFWEYNMTINNWDLTQVKNNILLTEIEQKIEAAYEYSFKLEGKKFNGGDLESPPIPAVNLHVHLKVNLPDMEFLNNFTLKIEDQIKSLQSPLFSDNAFNIEFTSGNNSLFFLNFTADFTVKFIDPVETTWAIDKLVENRNIRERIYFPSVIAGPKHIYVKYLTIYEKTITIDQVKKASSLFERSISYIDKNLTEFEGEVENSLIFTENVVKKRGLEVQLPFMIKGETSPFSFTYETVENLRVIITDNIYMPISGLLVEIIYYGKEYGTYVSNNKTQPLAPLITDENGEILLTNVSNGNYIVKIYQGQNITMAPVSSYRKTNYVATNIPHFPIWLLIYGSMNATIFLIGVYYHLKNKLKA